MTLLITITAASVLVLIALTFLGISYLFTGKTRIRAGSCGRLPKDKKTDKCGTEMTCDLCKDDNVREDEP